MAERPWQPEDEAEGLTEEELEAQSGDLLPDREAMSTLNPNIVVASDPAAVADALLGEPHDDDGSQADEPPEGAGGTEPASP